MMKRSSKKSLSFALLLILLAGVFAGGACAKADISGFEDLTGKKVGIQTGTQYEDALRLLNPDFIAEYFSDGNTMLYSVAAGKVDAYLSDDIGMPYEKLSYPNLEFLETPVDVLPLCIAVGKTPREQLLKQQLNTFITGFRQESAYDEMKQYWIGECDQDTNVTDRSGITGENGKLIVALEGGYVPFSYLSHGEIEGFDVDLVYRFCRMFGYEPVIEPMEFEALAPALATGKCDIAMNMLYYEERAAVMTFTEPYLDLKILLGYYTQGEEEGFSLAAIGEAFDKTFIRDGRWKLFADGAAVSLMISALSVMCGTAVGFLAYLFCRRRGRIVNRIADRLSWLVEGTPAVVLLMIFYFIVFGKSEIDRTAVAIIVFSIIFAVSMFSMLKGGEQAVGSGQLEAALSQGFSEMAAYIRIVLPQSAVYFLPGYCSNVVSLIKETSIVGYIAVLDLTKISDMIRGRTYEPFFPLISTAVIYFLISWLLTVGVRFLHKKLSPETRNVRRALRDVNTR